MVVIPSFILTGVNICAVSYINQHCQLCSNMQVSKLYVVHEKIPAQVKPDTAISSATVCDF